MQQFSYRQEISLRYEVNEVKTISSGNIFHNKVKEH